MTATKDLNYWKNNAEEHYLKVPISVLRYISELEKTQERSLPKTEIDWSKFPKSTQEKVEYVEPKQETLEEHFLGKMKEVLLFGNDAQAIRFMEKYFEAKQERSYSEEDMLEFANWCRIQDNKYPNRVINIQQLFEQFKKK